MSFVLIHGAGFGADCWDELTPWLDAEVLAVDLPGRGTRAAAGLQTVTLADCAQAVRDDVEARDLRDIVLVGHSFAGVTVPRVLDLIPGRIRHVVLVSAVVARSVTSTRPDRSLTEPVDLSGRRRQIPRTYVHLTQDQCYVEELQQRSIALLAADVVDLDTGHMAMISAPERLATILNAIHG